MAETNFKICLIRNIQGFHDKEMQMAKSLGCEENKHCNREFLYALATDLFTGNVQNVMIHLFSFSHKFVFCIDQI